MLRASAEATTTPLEPRAITDRSFDPLIPHGAVLLDLVDAVLLGTTDDRTASRNQVITDLGEAALVDASGVIGNFQMMNRIADATGMPVGKGTLKRTADWRNMLNLDQFNHL